MYHIHKLWSLCRCIWSLHYTCLKLELTEPEDMLDSLFFINVQLHSLNYIPKTGKRQISLARFSFFCFVFWFYLDFMLKPSNTFYKEGLKYRCLWEEASWVLNAEPGTSLVLPVSLGPHPWALCFEQLDYRSNTVSLPSWVWHSLWLDYYKVWAVDYTGDRTRSGSWPAQVRQRSHLHEIQPTQAKVLPDFSWLFTYSWHDSHFLVADSKWSCQVTADDGHF
jgi:hypothetical protein